MHTSPHRRGRIRQSLRRAALSTVVVTPFAQSLTAHLNHALAAAQDIADRHETPCGVWARDGWFTVCEIAPEMIEPDPELSGWVLWAVVDPTDTDTDR